MNYRTQYNRERKRIKSYIRRLEKAGAKVDFKVPEIPKRITAGSVSKLQKITPDKILSKTEIVNYSTGEIQTGRAVLGTIQKQKRGFDPETGEIFSLKGEQEIRKRDLQSDVQQALKTERQKIHDLPKRSDIVIDNTLKSIGELYDTEDAFVDTDNFDTLLSDLQSFESRPEWNDWYSNQKLKQVNKLITGLKESVNRKGINEVAKQINMNASAWHDLVLRVTIVSGDDDIMDDIDNSIDNMINSLSGAMSYDSAMIFAE